MILVVVGTQKFQCNRLLKKIDELVEKGIITEPVFTQIGHSDYIPKHCESSRFLDKEAFQEKVSSCSLLVTHGGIGTILTGINYDKPVVVFPRLKKYQEHVDDHQLEISTAFQKKSYVLVCDEHADLAQIIDQSKEFHYQKYVSEREKTVQTIHGFLQKIV